VIVCPNCRNSNPEEAQVCEACGVTLEPAAHALSARRAPSGRPKIEIPPPMPPPRWPLVFVLTALVGIVAGAVVYLFFRPNPCEGTNFSSENFGYCLAVPEGWTAEQAKVGSDATLDEFTIPTQSTTVLVYAVDLEQGTDLSAFADLVRQQEEQSGLTPGPAEATKLGGLDAQRWDMQKTNDAGESFQLREVVVVRDDVGWRITLNDLEDVFADHEAPFEQMLRSWHFL
jgi:hypothetical protein